MEEKYVEDFSPKTLSFKSSKTPNKGLTLNSLKLLDMMTHQIGDTEIGYPIEVNIKKSLKTLFSGSATVSPDHGYENQAVFVSSRNSQEMDMTEVNFYIFRLLNFISRFENWRKETGISETYFELYRNYFTNKLVGSSVLKT
jgi:hypothetical protein